MLDLKAEIEDAYNNLKAEENKARLGMVSGGNAGVQLADGTFLCTSNSSCPRVILLRSKGIQGTKNFSSIVTFEIGFAIERVVSLLQHSAKIQSYAAQQTIERTLKSGVKWRGTPDFELVVNDKLVILDTKSVSSVNTFIEFVCGDEIKIEYIAQLSTYMYEKGTKWGYIAAVTTPWVSEKFLTAGTKQKTGGSVKPDLHLFPLVIHDQQIKFKGNFLDFGMDDVLRHRETVGEYVATETVGPRPKDNKPCWGCDFRKSCDLYDAQYEKGFQSLVSSIEEVSKNA